MDQTIASFAGFFPCNYKSCPQSLSWFYRPRISEGGTAARHIKSLLPSLSEVLVPLSNFFLRRIFFNHRSASKVTKTKESFRGKIKGTDSHDTKVELGPAAGDL